MRSLFLSFFLLLVFLLGCVSSPVMPSHSSPASVNTTPFSLMTSDGFEIQGTHYTPLGAVDVNALPTLILLHQYNRDHFDYESFAIASAHQHGFSVLALDLRGFGSSRLRRGATVDATSFTDVDYQRMSLDVEEVRLELGVERVFLVGASIGANTVLNYAAAHPENTASIVLLSPGLNYKGISVADAMKTVTVPALIIASKGDAYSSSSSQQILSALPAMKKQLVLLDGSLHGTDMISPSQSNAASVKEQLWNWLK